MKPASLLQDKLVLVVDDEKDVLDSVAETLEMCTVHKVGDYETALQYLLSYSYDIVVLDIMGVNGFELLKVAVKRGFPAVMLTAHALTPESLKKSIRLGAVSFLPKERMGDLVEHLEDVVLEAANRPGRSFSTRWESFSISASGRIGEKRTGSSRNSRRN